MEDSSTVRVESELPPGDIAPHPMASGGDQTAISPRTERFLHPLALVESRSVGRGTRVWAFAHILPGASIGEDCNICDGVFIENEVVVGNRVTIKCGVQLWDGVTLEDDVFVGPNATFTNDPFPRSKRYPDRFERTIVRRGASIGANATILPGLCIGEDAVVGAGSVVTRSVPAGAIVYGNPARARGQATERELRPNSAPDPAHLTDFGPHGWLGVAGARVITLPKRVDSRGVLSFGQVGEHLPFVPRRYFVVTDVPTAATRGEHAHRQCDEFLVCLRGACTLTLDDGRRRASIRLDRSTLGVHASSKVWLSLAKFTDDAVLLVLASDVYDATDYVRDYSEFVGQDRA